MEENLEPNNEVINKISENTNKSLSEEIKASETEKLNNLEKKIEIITDPQKDTTPNVEIKNDNVTELKKDTNPNVEIKKDKSTELKKDTNPNVEIKNDNVTELKKDTNPNDVIKKDNNSIDKTINKPKKELPIEKKPFQEFINIHLIPAFIQEINQRGFEIKNICLENTNRPIAGDKCWVVNCEIKDVCSLWLSFEKDDISSQKSISISKPNQEPSIIESFLIDEKRISLKLIISRVIQRLNGQKLIGVN